MITHTFHTLLVENRIRVRIRVNRPIKARLWRNLGIILDDRNLLQDGLRHATCLIFARSVVTRAEDSNDHANDNQEACYACNDVEYDSLRVGET